MVASVLLPEVRGRTYTVSMSFRTRSFRKSSPIAVAGVVVILLAGGGWLGGGPEWQSRPGGLRPGTFARAEIVVSADRPTVLVPEQAIVTFAGLERVFGVADGRAVEKRIRTGRRIGGRVEVLEGVAAGEQVVVDPGNLAGGQPVTLKP